MTENNGAKRYKNLRLCLLVLLILNVPFSAFLLTKYYLIPHYREYLAFQIQPFKTAYERPINLQTRKFLGAGSLEKYDTEMDSKTETSTSTIDLNKTALIVIDTWATHGNDGWMERAQKNMETKVAPLLELLRKHNVTIIYAPSNEKIAPVVSPMPGELILSSSNLLYNTKEFDKYLKKHDITTLLYTGYAVNWCIINKPMSLMRMSELGYDTILVRDATIAFETPESLSGEWAYKMAIYMVESLWGRTTTVDDLRAALEPESIR